LPISTPSTGGAAERLRRPAHAVQTVLTDREVLRQTVDSTIRDFMVNERRHTAMEEHVFLVAIEVLQPQDWADITSASTDQKDPLFSEIVEKRFEAVRDHILQLEQEAEAERA
jgi:hypothetical protein